MDHDFLFDKPKMSKDVFGIDNDKVFSRKDSKALEGDSETRQFIRVSKSDLGSCIPLAMETDGSIFSTKRMDKKNMGKKFSSVFSKRIALKAKKSSCQECECMGHNTGAAYMVCLPCSFPMAESDYVSGKVFSIE